MNNYCTFEWLINLAKHCERECLVYPNANMIPRAVEAYVEGHILSIEVMWYYRNNIKHLALWEINLQTGIISLAQD